MKIEKKHIDSVLTIAFFTFASWCAADRFETLEGKGLAVTAVLVVWFIIATSK